MSTRLCGLSLTTWPNLEIQTHSGCERFVLWGDVIVLVQLVVFPASCCACELPHPADGACRFGGGILRLRARSIEHDGQQKAQREGTMAAVSLMAACPLERRAVKLRRFDRRQRWRWPPEALTKTDRQPHAAAETRSPLTGVEEGVRLTSNTG